MYNKIAERLGGNLTEIQQQAGVSYDVGDCHQGKREVEVASPLDPQWTIPLAPDPSDKSANHGRMDERWRGSQAQFWYLAKARKDLSKLPLVSR